MKKLITNNKLLAIINVLYLVLVTMQQTQYIDLFPFDTTVTNILKGTIALVIGIINVLGLKASK